MGRRQAVRHWVLISAYAGSNPAAPANVEQGCVITGLKQSVGVAQAAGFEPKGSTNLRSGFERRSRPRRGEGRMP